VLFFKSFFPEVDSPYFSGCKKGVFLQPLTNARQGDTSDVPVVCSSLVMDESSTRSGFQPGSFGCIFGIAAFFGCAPFPRAASFLDVGMFPWQ
jgi:hypothetical protein